MADTEYSDEVRAYLRQLDAALVDVPCDTAQDIRAGIEEELAALDRQSAHERILDLGDPAFIASEARRESLTLHEPRRSGLGSRLYVVAAGLTVAMGIFAVPVIGALIGFIMVWCSPAWRRWEKLLATGIPLATGAVTATSLALMRTSTTTPIRAPFPGFETPSIEELAGSGFTFLFTPVVTVDVLVAMAIANLVVGVWLLIRALRRL